MYEVRVREMLIFRCVSYRISELICVVNSENHGKSDYKKTITSVIRIGTRVLSPTRLKK